MANQNYNVRENYELLSFILEMYKGMSKTKVKNLLVHKRIAVNNKIETRYNFSLHKGDVVTVLDKNSQQQENKINLTILYEDSYFIVVEKPYGLLTIATETEKSDTLYKQVSLYVKQKNPQSKIFILHRLDRDTSGVIVFAKDLHTQRIMQENWSEFVTLRQYQAVVEGTMNKSNGRLEHYLYEGKTGFMHVTSQSEKGKKAVMDFKVIAEKDSYSLLELTLETGRKNQIRVQLQACNCPIVGDKKYGAQTNPIKRMCLHANTLHFIHPYENREMKFESKLPNVIQKLCK